ncbi:MAG TPA: NADPH-dependent FMN reductase [Solirubrobacterales bacterium]|nr:NADPH-dependent FMN reductase [Solirubrobacterales bacterium]
MAGAYPDLLVVLGSATPPGRFRGALTAAVDCAGPGADLVDLADHPLPFAGSSAAADAGGVVEAIAGARAVVFATPVYRGSLSGVLKNLIDLLPVEALAGKVVGLAAMGATDHHFLGAERHLRDVLSFFGVVLAPVAVYLTSADFSDGEPSPTAALALDELLAGVTALSEQFEAHRDDGAAPEGAAAQLYRQRNR